MKPALKWSLLLAVLLFMGYVVYGSMARVEAQCEICLEFNGETVCRRGAGATSEEARMAAQESACGGIASGMSESIRCRNTPPQRVQCSTE